MTDAAPKDFFYGLFATNTPIGLAEYELPRWIKVEPKIASNFDSVRGNGVADRKDVKGARLIYAGRDPVSGGGLLAATRDSVNLPDVRAIIPLASADACLGLDADGARHLPSPCCHALRNR